MARKGGGGGDTHSEQLFRGGVPTSGLLVQVTLRKSDHEGHRKRS